MLHLPAPNADTPTIEDLRAALGALRPDTRPAWGRLDATGMALHCARFVDLYAGRLSVARPLRWLARLFGPSFLRRAMAKPPTETPRNLPTVGALRVAPAGTTESGVAPLDGARASLDAALAEAAGWTGALDHPLYGPTDAETARALVRHHTAHHFHQFGLLEGAHA